MRKSLYALLPAATAVAIVAAFTMTIDWSSFTDALTNIVPDAVALAAVVVGGAITIALVFKGGKTVLNWATRWVH